MTRSRGWCALALVSIAACSFPDYEVPIDGRPRSCSDGVQNGEETATDCGGSECAACPPCNDGKKNGDEEGVDCGGSCDACPSCDDGKTNGSESDTDCGGSCPERCDTDSRCTQSADCISLVCNGVCQRSDCLDGVRNGAETGEDCGGGCPGCPNGSACNEGDDCESARCVDAICVDAKCTDGVKNAAETDIDCGGGQCAPCMAPGRCEIDDDCASRICDEGVCAAATCGDTVQNQDESWPDCGGTVCPACEIGEGCVVATDCMSQICLRGTCVPENQSGQPLSRSGWKLTSSESDTESGTDDVFDGVDTTQWTSGKNQYSKMHVDLDLGKQSIFFRALLKEVAAPYDQNFPGRIDVYVSSDGVFGEPTKTVQGNQWLWVDFEGAEVGRYLRFEITEPKQNLPWSFGEIYVYN